METEGGWVALLPLVWVAQKFFAIFQLSTLKILNKPQPPLSDVEQIL